LPGPNALEEIYRRDGRKVFATLVRLLAGFDMAEEALHDAFRIAADRWPTEGVPRNPAAWLISAGRFRAIDRMRRNGRLVPLDDVVHEIEAKPDPAALPDEEDVLEDDQLRLIFTCCHPSLAEEAQIALTLREVCGLTTEAIARAVLVKPTALAQRIVRAKSKIRDARIPYRVPQADELPERLPSVLRVIYLIFNEGYAPSTGETTNAELSQEAIRLARLVRDRLPQPEVIGLLALMLLQESRRSARETDDGEYITLEEQDRTRWDRVAIAEGQALAEQALRSGCIGTYALQAAIAAVHADAPSWVETDWVQIIGLYDALLRVEPSPVIALNRAVALAMRDGAPAALPIVEELMRLPELVHYAPAHAAHAEQGPATRYLQGRLNRLPSR
jgi:RNA polymerase sigma-70 factor, ECF subfamily